MNVEKLRPMPELKTEFSWSSHSEIPTRPGCYALVTFSGEVLYVGLATGSIAGRVGSHLDTPEKWKAGPRGMPFWCYFTIRDSSEVNVIERGWMNQAILEDGDMPPLNKVFSPI
jgi:hypothetical protein